MVVVSMRQKYTFPTNIVDFCKISFFCGEFGSGAEAQVLAHFWRREKSPKLSPFFFSFLKI